MSRKINFGLLITIICLNFAFNPLAAQDLNLYQKQTFVQNNDTLNYRVLFPENYNPTKKYPVVLFLHGAGERGNDNEKQLTHGAKLFLNDTARKQFPAIIIFPQCPENSFWANVKFDFSEGKREFHFQADGEPTPPLALVQGLLKAYIAQDKVDTKRIYVMGLSMGGMGTFELLWRNPKTFAGAIPICGGANPKTAKKYAKKTAVWIFHGAKDNVVPPDFSRTMYKALQDAKAKVKYTEYPEAEHNSWDNTFAEPGLLSWLFSQSLK
ncbi:alpha/beta hydrolase-fold protein [Solitalea sp. MAHUQ-68]|uniref:Alpha/beta hydrolase-fold protein n=1 Tax=Solitalea agri TaxID=2953739 RepID=A0A9X2F0Q8_9SPHI|nr:dienelactone hydrolase family protein [Solitalea agri]MCO4291935.1 alpha/beta hydrolase-fold protein [Solitalea agri]